MDVRCGEAGLERQFVRPILNCCVRVFYGCECPAIKADSESGS